MKRIKAKYLYTLRDTEPLNNAIVELDDDLSVTSIIENSNSDDNVDLYIDGLVCPSFVNTHCHIELSYLWKKFKKGTGMAGFIDQINAMRDNKSYDEKLRDIDYWMQRLWEQGVSALGDISNCADSFPIKAKSPIYTRTFLEVFGSEPKDCESVMNSVLDLQKKADEYGLDAAPTPHSCYTTSPDLLRASSKAAFEAGFLSYHSQESQEEEDMISRGVGAMYENRKRAGMSMPKVTGTSSLIYFIDQIKQIHPAPFTEKILLVHEVCMSEDDMRAVNSLMTNAYIALCPLSNIFIHNSLPPIDLMIKNKLRLTIGTDSLSSNDDLDMVKELFCIQENYSSYSLGDLLTWACKNGAEFLGKSDELGTIEVGKHPGLVAIENLSSTGQLTTASRSRRLF